MIANLYICRTTCPFISRPDFQQWWNNQCGSNKRWHCAQLYECVSRNLTHFFCLAATALCWWPTASLCWNNWSTCCICPWVAAIKFTLLLSRTSPCYRSACPKCFCLESLLKCRNIFLSVMWARCSLHWVCWTCLVWCTTATCPPWRRRCLTCPLTRSLSPAPRGPRLPAGSAIAPCGTGSAGLGSNSNRNAAIFSTWRWYLLLSVLSYGEEAVF